MNAKNFSAVIHEDFPQKEVGKKWYDFRKIGRQDKESATASLLTLSIRPPREGLGEAGNPPFLCERFFAQNNLRRA